jgi:hypothetical protein
MKFFLHRLKNESIVSEPPKGIRLFGNLDFRGWMQKVIFFGLFFGVCRPGSALLKNRGQ